MPPAVAPLSAMPRPSGVRPAWSAPMTPAIAHSESSLTAQSAKVTSSAKPAIVCAAVAGDRRRADAAASAAGAAAWSTTGADGSHAEVSSTASENTGERAEDADRGERPMSGTSARITVTTARFARPLNPATRSGLRNAASAAPDEETAPPAPMPPAIRPATTAAGTGTSAATPNPIVATASPMRATASRRGPGAELRDGEPGDRGSEQCAGDDPARGEHVGSERGLRRGDHVRREVDAEVAGDADPERGDGAGQPQRDADGGEGWVGRLQTGEASRWREFGTRRRCARAKRMVFVYYAY